MKTDATREVVYSILLRRYYDNLESEKFIGLFEDIEKSGSNIEKVEELAGIGKNQNYFFPEWMNIINESAQLDRLLLYNFAHIKYSLKKLQKSEQK